MKDDDNYAVIVRNGAQFKSVSKWNRNLGVSTKHMTSHRAKFNMYEAISSCNVYLDDDSVVEAIGMGSIVVETIVRGQINRIRIIDALHVSNLQANFLSAMIWMCNLT